VDEFNPGFCSVDGVLFDKCQAMLVKCPPGKAGSYAFPSSVTNLDNNGLFYGLTRPTYPAR
jgi:hypothetical protein